MEFATPRAGGEASADGSASTNCTKAGQHGREVEKHREKRRTSLPDGFSFECKSCRAAKVDATVRRRLQLSAIAL